MKPSKHTQEESRLEGTTEGAGANNNSANINEGNLPDDFDTSALDARIEELTRRRTEIERQQKNAAAARGGGATGGGAAGRDVKEPSSLAGIAGAAADSFAQAFVDRFASSHTNHGMDGMGGDFSRMGSMDGMMMMGDRRSSVDSGNFSGMNNNGGAMMNPYFSRMNGMGMMGNMGMMFGNGNMNGGGGGSSGSGNPFPPSALGMHPMMYMNAMNQMNSTANNTTSMISHPSLPPTNNMTDETPKLAKAAKASKPRKRSPRTEVPVTPELLEASKGPFQELAQGKPLALEEDKDWLTPLHCFVRRHCVEVFTATEIDIKAPSKGKRKPIQIGQVGIRCPHCVCGSDPDARERGSVYFPTSISSIYNATMNLLQRHIHSCPRVPKEIMEKYNDLKRDDARSGTSKKYWVESARSIGFVDTVKGIRLKGDGKNGEKLVGIQGEEMKQEEGKDGEEEETTVEGKGQEEKKESSEAKDDSDDNVFFKKDKSVPPPEMEAVPIILPSDKDSSTQFSFLLLSQMQPCVFTEADRLGKRKGLPVCFAGLACRHCFGGYGSGRFFPSSIKTLSDTSKTLNVLYNHMTRCRKCPPEILEELNAAKKSHEDERSQKKFGSQKAFFGKIWSRLHDNRPYDPVAVRAVLRKNTDGTVSTARQRTLQYPPGMSGNDMAFMAGQSTTTDGTSQGMSQMMGGGSSQGNGNPMMMPQQQQQRMMNMMGMMTPEMMMREYQDQFMGGMNGMGQFGGGGNGGFYPGNNTNNSGENTNMSMKRSAEDNDQSESNKRVKEV